MDRELGLSKALAFADAHSWVGDKNDERPEGLAEAEEDLVMERPFSTFDRYIMGLKKRRQDRALETDGGQFWNISTACSPEFPGPSLSESSASLPLSSCTPSLSTHAEAWVIFHKYTYDGREACLDGLLPKLCQSSSRAPPPLGLINSVPRIHLAGLMRSAHASTRSAPR